MTEDSNPYPDGTPVYARYPLPGQDKQPRVTWAWLPGVIEERCDQDEWLVCIEDHRTAMYVPDDDEPFFPGCFRDATEIKARQD